MIEALKDETAIVRREAASALGAIGPNAKEAVPTLIEVLLSDKDRVFLAFSIKYRLLGKSVSTSK